MLEARKDIATLGRKMSDSLHRDTIIVGFGLAGALLTWRWVHESGRSAIVIDPCNVMNASRAAAGILNPVTGKRLVKSWNVDAMLPAARKTYRKIEGVLGDQFFYDKTIRRIYQSEEELKRWAALLGDSLEEVMSMDNLHKIEHF